MEKNRILNDPVCLVRREPKLWLRNLCILFLGTIVFCRHCYLNSYNHVVIRTLAWYEQPSDAAQSLASEPISLLLHCNSSVEQLAIIDTAVLNYCISEMSLADYSISAWVLVDWFTRVYFALCCLFRCRFYFLFLFLNRWSLCMTANFVIWCALCRGYMWNKIITAFVDVHLK